MEHVIGNDGLPVWEGTTASQGLSGAEDKNWILKGGAKQLFIPTSLDNIPSDLSIKSTEWKK